MSLTNTDIQLKRSKNTLQEVKDIQLNFAEPMFVDNTEHEQDGALKKPCKAYLVLGRKQGEDEFEDITVKKSPVIKALNAENADNIVFHDLEAGSITNEAGDQIPVNRLTTISKAISDLDSDDASKYYLLCQTGDDNVVYRFTLDDLGIFINGRGIMQGAAWNDYAETRKLVGEALPGNIVCDNGDGTVSLSKEKYQACAHIVSDTFGHLIGKKDEEYIPIAVAGKALVRVHGDVKVGDCICAGNNGLGEKMTRQEIANYPDRIVGVVCEIPKETKIDSVEIDGRVWVNIK